ncbi:MAG: TolC family protein [Reyranella sp.]|uniref:TolC family protein n=1 Tax=Reyranella sp. TaxID=1929291 RepID=UPI00273072A9|nr:TolC family protein [Reyranella sp.]MDP1967013.1 TolC family protein [Reyranella sp.]MDP2377691.1 TolC family protein [Reyranella sp.]
MNAPTKIAVVALLSLLAAGCAKFSGDGGMAPVTDSVRREIGKDAMKLTSAEDLRRARGRVQALLSESLAEDTAVQIALLNNRGLQAAYNDLGISEAEYVQTSLPPNPAITVGRTFGTGGFVEVGFQLVGNLLAFATLPRRTEIAKREFEEARYRAVATTLSLTVDVRRAYVRAVAAQQRLALLEQSRQTADASARLMKQLGETGAANKLDQGRVSAFYAELSAQVAQARLSVNRERETLNRILGLWGADLDYKLPARLPALPTTPDPLSDVEVEAMRRRVDLIILRYEIVTLAKSVGFVDATRYLSFLELGLGYRNEVETNDAGEQTSKNRYGFELGIVIPIFDTGEARVTTARETYMRAVNRLTERSVNARSEARIAYATYRATHDIARYYQTRIVPLRRQISAEVLLRYNGMLVDVFELLIDERERIAANLGSLDALRDYHLAVADLQAALIVGGTVPPSGVINTTPPPETIPLGF